MSNQKIRVMEVAGGLHFGGAEIVLAQLATGLDPARFQTSVFCTGSVGAIGEQIREQGVRVTLGANSTRLHRYLTPLSLLREIREVNPQIVHTHGVEALAAAGPLAMAGLARKWIHTFHYGNYPYPRARQMAMEGFLARRCQHPVAVSHAQRDALVKFHRLQTGQIRVVWNGVRPNPHVGNPDIRAAKRREFGFDSDTLVIGTVAVLSEQKGIPFLLDAARIACARNEKLRFLIVGGGHGQREQECHRLAAEYGIQDKVRFAGWRSDVQQLLTSFDVFVMSSLWEAMPLALLEAMAAARPIVVTDVGDNSRLVTPGSSAIVVPARSGAALAAAIEAVAGDDARRLAMATAAQREFEQKYTVKHMLSSYERMFAEVMSARPSNVGT